MNIGICQRTLCGHFCCNMARKAVTASDFFREFIKAPTQVGSICPSGRSLAKALTATVPSENDGLIIDLGAGSGVVTEELLRAGIAPERIVAIEISSGFREAFQKRYPGVSFIVGDARRLDSILERSFGQARVAAILSSLPFRVLPSDLARGILEELKKVLVRRGGLFSQYTYAWWMDFPLRELGMLPKSSRMVYANIPPARLESYAVQ